MMSVTDPESITEVPGPLRARLVPILDQSFEGIYRWHARRALRSVPWVRQAIRGGLPAGLSMLTMVGAGLGYVYYVAVIPAQRRAGLGGMLLDDALEVLGTAGALETLACIRGDNTASVRLFRSRGFERIRLRDLSRMKGLAAAVVIWAKMVVAPREQVFLRRARLAGR